MGCLPNLVALDTEYLGSGNYRVPSTPLPALEQLTVRTGSVDVLGPDRLWTWTRSLLPHVGSLKSFTLNSFSVYGRMAIPWPFVVFLATKQGQSLEELIIGVAMLSLDSLSQLCLKCCALETVHCTVASPDVVGLSPRVVRCMLMLTSHSPEINRQSHKQRKLPPHPQSRSHVDREWCGRTLSIRPHLQLLRGFGRVSTQSTYSGLFASCLRGKKRDFYQGRSSIDDASTGFQVASSKDGRHCLHREDELSIHVGRSLSTLFL